LLQKQLRLLAADKADLVEANLNAAETLIDAARPMVPRLTGALVASLKASKAQGYAQANAGSPKRVPYANPIHWGWSIVSVKQQKLKPGTFRNIKPQPFFAKALGYTYQEIIDNYERDLQKMINKYGLGE